jgi:hypothetical protein
MRRSKYGLQSGTERVCESLGNRLKCSFIVMLHKYIICFDLDMYFLIDSNMSTIVMTINKCMHLVMFYYFAVINCKYHNLLKSYIHLKFTAF